MNITLADFGRMIRNTGTTAGFTERSGLFGRVRRAYGQCFSGRLAGRHTDSLTKAGVQEYNHVKKWIESGAKVPLKPVNSTKVTSNGKRVVPLYEYRPQAGSRTAKLTSVDRKAMLVKARAVAPSATPAAPELHRTMASIQRNGVIVFMRTALESLLEMKGMPEEAKATVAETLAIAGTELKAMSRA